MALPAMFYVVGVMVMIAVRGDGDHSLRAANYLYEKHRDLVDSRPHTPAVQLLSKDFQHGICYYG